jgi:hypothetical protein
MSETLRDLLIERAARLQERPALTAPEWGTLSYAQLRQRVEGIALGVLAKPLSSVLYATTGSVWDWTAELAVAAAGRIWDASGQPIPSQLLGGHGFNDESGRAPYHALEHQLTETTLFRPGLSQGQWRVRLRRWNDRQGWDHETQCILPLERLGDPALRTALWCSLYAGAHAILAAPYAKRPVWDETLFEDLR